MDQDRQDATNSQLAMLRCLIALAYADGIFSGEERAFLDIVTNRLSLSPTQQKQLERDLDSPENIGELFVQIEDAECRGDVVHFAQLMAQKDGILDPSEEELIEQLTRLSMATLNADRLREDIRALKERLQSEEAKDAENDGYIVPYLKSFFQK